MNLRIFFFLIYFFFCRHLEGSDLPKAISATLNAFSKANNHSLSIQRNKYLVTIPVTFDKLDLKNCKLEKQIRISENVYNKMQKKDCTTMIETMRYHEFYTSKHILFFENVPVTCTPDSLIALLYKCL